MSGIFGLFHRDQQPIESEPLEVMRAAMAYWGPDGSNVWHEGSLGLGSLQLYNTPQSLHERLPRRTRDGHVVLTAEARLDNRKELCNALNVPASERRQIVDSELILRAYQRWGEECPPRLIGDWSFAIWEPAAQKLFLAVDHLGCTGLYYFTNSRVFVFASCIKAVLAHPQVPRRLNELRMAQALALWPDATPRTAYEEVLPLQSGHSLTVTPHSLRVRPYWYPEKTPELRLKSRQEYVEGLLEVYSEAVRCRLRSHHPVATMLSGGLDSGSVAALAARELGQSGERLTAYSSVPLYDVDQAELRGRFGDETPFVEATARHAGNIDVQWITARATSPLAGMRRAVELHDTPIPNAGNFFWLTELAEAAQRQGFGTLLTGQGGNLTVSWNGITGPGLRFLLRNKRWRAALRHLVFSGMPLGIRGLLAGRGQVRTADLALTPINSHFARRFDVARRKADTATIRALRRQDARALRCVSFEFHRMGGSAIMAELGAGYGMEWRDPTYDLRVATYCLSVPDWVYTGPQGESRWLMRASMSELLPDVVRNNRKTGQQAADLGERLRHSAEEVNETLRRLDESPLAQNYLDLERMNEVWQALQQEISMETAFKANAILAFGLQTGLFLLREEGLQ